MVNQQEEDAILTLQDLILLRSLALIGPYYCIVSWNGMGRWRCLHRLMVFHWSSHRRNKMDGWLGLNFFCFHTFLHLVGMGPIFWRLEKEWLCKTFVETFLKAILTVNGWKNNPRCLSWGLAFCGNFLLCTALFTHTISLEYSHGWRKCLSFLLPFV